MFHHASETDETYQSLAESEEKQNTLDEQTNNEYSLG